jgi:hypothetical protein
MTPAIATDVLAREHALRRAAREAQAALVAGNPGLAMMLLGDVREMSLRSTEQLGAARGVWGA